MNLFSLVGDLNGGVDGGEVVIDRFGRE